MAQIATVHNLEWIDKILPLLYATRHETYNSIFAKHVIDTRNHNNNVSRGYFHISTNQIIGISNFILP